MADRETIESIYKCPCGAATVTVSVTTDNHMYPGPAEVTISCACNKCRSEYSFRSPSNEHPRYHAVHQSESAKMQAWFATAPKGHRSGPALSTPLVAMLRETALAAGKTKGAWRDAVQAHPSLAHVVVGEIPRHKTLDRWLHDLVTVNLETMLRNLGPSHPISQQAAALEAAWARYYAQKPTIAVIELK